MSHKIIILDDDQVFRKNLCKALSGRGYDVHAAESGQEALRLLTAARFDAAVIDMKMPGMDGVDVIREMIEIQPSIKPIILTGFASIPDAVKTMQTGGCNYLLKPCDVGEVEEAIKKAVGVKAIVPLGAGKPYCGITGASQAIKKVISAVCEIKDLAMPVLISGESGTGKELVARALHFDSVRKDKPFVAINCASLKPELLENELFGHIKGAFTGAVEKKDGLVAAADGGTLFIDEIADMDLMIQASLLRFIETGCYRHLGGSKEYKANVRIVAAINKDIEEEVRGGRFRKDLYYRLNVCRVHIPPLRQRREDIGPLAERFASDILALFGRKVAFSDGAIERLKAHSWPGNVRELYNIIQRISVMARDEVVTRGVVERFLQHLPLDPARGDGEPMSSLEESEKKHIASSLEANRWNVSKTSRLLGIDRRTLQRKMQRYGIRKGA